MALLKQLLFQTKTAYDQYQVVERRYEGRPSRVLFSGQRKAAQSGIGLDDNPDLLFDYNQRFLELANGLYPKHVLVIGGGAYTLPMALVAALPDTQVDVVEIDPELAPIAERFFGLKASPRLQLLFGDGRQFISQTSDRYDLIIVDVFSELSIPRQFLTLEFVTLLRTKLTDGGCLAMNVIASYQGKNAGFIISQIAAYQQVFEQLDIFPAGYGLTSWLPQNLVLIAQRSPVHDLKHYLRYAAIELPAATANDVLHDSDQIR